MYRSGFVLGTRLPPPSFLPSVQHVFNEYMVFETNVPALTAAFYMIYYAVLDPVAAVCTPTVLVPARLLF